MCGRPRCPQVARHLVVATTIPPLSPPPWQATKNPQNVAPVYIKSNYNKAAPFALKSLHNCGAGLLKYIASRGAA